jgi:50S ribosomal protein L16 3-hydroxylase
MLYLPPGVAHDGVALDDDCMTYSIGFRAPSRHDLIGLWADEVLGHLAEDDRYADPALAAQANAGEIAPQALARLQAMVAEKLLDPAAFARWFGSYSSQRKYPEIDWAPEQAITPQAMRKALAQGATLERNPASRFAYIEGQDGVQLFVDGQCHDCHGALASFARTLCAQPRPQPAPAAEALDLITRLYNEGSLGFAPED